jgi:hypothetical protein
MNKLRSASFRLVRTMLVVLMGFGMLFATSKSSMAQGTTGTITGTVTDPSGSVVAGATVTIKQIETNAVRNLTSTEAGTYKATMLPPGTYSVKVEKAGFKSYEQNKIVLTINEVSLIDAQLTVGSQAESVEVTSAGPVIQTEDSSVGQVIDSQAIQNTPLNGRLSVMGLIALAPGMQGVGAQDQMATRGLTVAAGTGSRNSYGGLGSAASRRFPRSMLSRSSRSSPRARRLSSTSRRRSSWFRPRAAMPSTVRCLSTTAPRAPRPSRTSMAQRRALRMSATSSAAALPDLSFFRTTTARIARSSSSLMKVSG